MYGHVGATTCLRYLHHTSHYIYTRRKCYSHKNISLDKRIFWHAKFIRGQVGLQVAAIMEFCCFMHVLYGQYVTFLGHSNWYDFDLERAAAIMQWMWSLIILVTRSVILTIWICNKFLEQIGKTYDCSMWKWGEFFEKWCTTAQASNRKIKGN